MGVPDLIIRAKTGDSPLLLISITPVLSVSGMVSWFTKSEPVIKLLFPLML